MTRKITHEEYVERHEDFMEDCLEGLQILWKEISEIERMDQREGRTKLVAFYDAFDRFVDACFWYLNAVYRCGATPALGFRTQVRKACAGNPGAKRMERFENIWKEAKERRNLFHHNWRVNYVIVMNEGERLMSPVANVNSWIGEVSKAMEASGKWEGETPTQDKEHPLESRLDDIVVGCKTLADDLKQIRNSEIS